MLYSLIWGFAESNFRFLLFRELGVPNGSVVKEIEVDGVAVKVSSNVSWSSCELILDVDSGFTLQKWSYGISEDPMRIQNGTWCTSVSAQTPSG